MKFYSYYRISKPSETKVAPERVQEEYRRLRSRTFWGVCAAYAQYYVCRMALSVVKQPLIDSGTLSAAQLGLVGSAMLFAYAFGKFVNGFVADYCNIRRFMTTGLLVSALVNLLMGALGIVQGHTGLPTMVLFIAFALLWGVNGWTQSMGAPPAVISLSRWFPLSRRGTFYSILCATPYLGKFLSFIVTSFVVASLGWQYGFLFSAVGAQVIRHFAPVRVRRANEKGQRVFPEGFAVKGVQGVRQGVVAKFRAEKIAREQKGTQAGVARVGAVALVVADGPPDLPGFEIAAEHRPGGNARRPVKIDALLHQHVDHAAGEHAPHGAALHNKPCFHAIASRVCIVYPIREKTQAGKLLALFINEC